MNCYLCDRPIVVRNGETVVGTWTQEHKVPVCKLAHPACQAKEDEKAMPHTVSEWLLNPCTICGQPIEIKGGTAYIGDGDGRSDNGGSFAHEDCYYRRETTRLETKVQEYEEWLKQKNLRDEFERWKTRNRRPEPQKTLSGN